MYYCFNFSKVFFTPKCPSWGVHGNHNIIMQIANFLFLVFSKYHDSFSKRVPKYFVLSIHYSFYNILPVYIIPLCHFLAFFLIQILKLLCAL